MMKNTRRNGKLDAGSRFSMTFLVTLTINFCLSKAGLRLQRDLTPVRHPPSPPHDCLGINRDLWTGLMFLASFFFQIICS